MSLPLVKKFIRTTPVIRSVYWHCYEKRANERRAARMGEMTPKEVFTEIFEKNLWGDTSSVSGTGSDLTQTSHLQHVLRGAFDKHQIRSLLDIPCGDFFWMQRVDLEGIDYIGADIVDQLIAENTQRHAKAGVRFTSLDLLKDSLPDVDAILVRDLFVHLSFDDVQTCIDNILASDIKYLFCTTFPAVEENQNIVSGEWRMINLERAPFGFPPPLELIRENCTESKEFESKSLGVWSVSDLKTALS